MQLKMNVWSINGSYAFVKPDSSDNSIYTELSRQSGHTKFLGTTTIEVEPPMREVVKEAEVECVGLYNRMTLLKGEVPTDSYDRKLVYKVKDPA